MKYQDRMIMSCELKELDTTCVFEGLVGRKDLNGKFGKVVEYLEERLRYNVRCVDSNEIVAVKKTNLRFENEVNPPRIQEANPLISLS